MISATSLDAVFFFLPPFAHGSEIFVAEKRIPFFVEKPIELTLEGAKKILKKVMEKDVMTSVGYMNRYRESVNKAKEEFKEDPAILTLGGWVGGTPKKEGWWWVDGNKSGGQFHEQVTHTVDLVRYICGEVKKVQAFAARGLNKNVPKSYNIEDAAVVNMKLENGGVANLHASCSSNAIGGLFLNIYAYETAAIFTGWDHSVRILKVGREAIEIKGESDIFEIEDNNFIDAVRSNDLTKIKCSYGDGIKTLAITIAANDSMKSGISVRVPSINEL
jgi:predicted dehydrogenase